MNISVVRPLAAASMLCAMLCAAPAAFAIDSGDIVVDSVKGEVHVTMNGAAAPVRAGTVLELPATIRTGRDGALELRQGATTVSVGPETTLEFPALEERGGPIDRIVQPRGNAFYSIGKRAGRRLRVETPNLVGVIKGTQFNVAAQDESTTISLFEGLLEVHATDESSVIDLKAGEIASRKRGDKTISVIKMDGGKAPPASRGPGGTSGSNDNGTSAPSLRQGSVLVDRGVDLGPVDVDLDSHVGIEARGGAVGAVGAGGANVATGVSGPAAVEVNTASNVNLGAGAIDVVANAKADTAALTTAASAVTAVNVAASNVSANVGVSTSTAVGSVAAVSTTAAAAADLGTKPSVAVSTAAATNVAGAAAAVTTTANVTTGNVDLGASVAGVNLNAAVDLGLGKPATTDTSTSTGAAATPATTTTTTTTTPAPVIDTSGLLDSLLHRSRKK